MTRDQLDRIVHAVTTALVIGQHCTPAVANERARNIAQALLDASPRQTYSTIALTLHTRESEFADLGAATTAALRAYRCAMCSTNMERMTALVILGLTAEEASAYLQRHGWTVPDGTVMA